jgi:ClpP class serine protease
MPGFMTAVNKLDKSKGLDLILHTPGGEINATEQIVFYLRKIFKGDIRAIVPHLAMSNDRSCQQEHRYGPSFQFRTD